MKEIIDFFTKQGFKIFPCNSDKSPNTMHGFKNAHNNIEILYKQFYKSDMLIGLPTGDINGIVVIDFDIKDGRSVDELKEELKQYGELPDTLEVETISGGRHLYYKCDSTQLSSHSKFFDKSLPIDIRGNNGYVVTFDYKKYFPLDIEDDIEDLKSLMSDLPDWIEKYRKPTSDYQNVPAESFLPESEIREIRSALSYISSDDRDMWVNVGHALKNTGAPQAKGLWTEWSMKSDKFDPIDQEKKWKTFKPNDITIASIFHIAKQNGWVTTYENSSILITDEKELEEKLQSIPSYEKKPFPKELLNPPGLVGEIAEYMNSQGRREQPILSIAASLTFCGALMGRRFQDEDHMRTNIYCMGIGKTGCGKENARKIIKKIIRECNISDMKYMCMVENIASETSIYSALTISPSQVFLLDEIGIFLRSTQNKQIAHLAGVPAALLKLFTSADVLTSGKSYADTKKQIHIDNPNLCIYGTATPDQFYESLSKENIEQGLLGRFLIFESENARPFTRYDIKVKKPDRDLIEKIKHIYMKPTNAYPEGNVSNIEIINPLIVPATEEAKEMFKCFDIEIDKIIHKEMESEEGVYQLYTRCLEVSKKIALIIAIGSCVYDEQPVISPLHVDYAIKLSRYLIESLHDAIEMKISDNNLEKEVKKMLNLIRINKKLSLSVITRKFQHLKSHERKDILTTLIESKYIEEYLDTSTGKPRRIYIAI